MSRVINFISKVYARINFSSYEKYIGEKYNSSFFLRFHKWWREQLTPSGRTLFVLWSVSTLPATMDISRPLYLIFLGIGLLIFFDHSISYLFIKIHVSVKRLFPTHMHCGDTIAGFYEIQNLLDKNIPDLQVFDRIAHIGLEQTNIQIADNLPSQAKTKLGYSFVATIRGHYKLTDIIVASLFPFGITRKTNSIYSPFDLFVLPKLYPLNLTNLIKERNTASIGQEQKQKSKSSIQNDYIGSRDYQYGDSLQNIDHKAWARTGKPITKIFESKSNDVPTIIFLNTESLAVSTKEYETAVSLATSAIDHCQKTKGNFHFLFCEGDFTECLEDQTSPIKSMEYLATVNPKNTQIGAFKALLAKIPKNSSHVYIVTPGYNDYIAKIFDAFHSSNIGSSVLISHNRPDDKSLSVIDEHNIFRFDQNLSQKHLT